MDLRMIGTTFLLALREIRRHVLRSFLTTLGIIIGVAAVVTMATLGNAATRSVEQSISSLGLGVRVSQGRQMSLRIDWAHVLETSITRPDNRNRVHFTFVYAL